jgi:hypothetical protein
MLSSSQLANRNLCLNQAPIQQMVCGIFVDVVKWRDNHVLIFYAIIYFHYAEYTDELLLDDLPVAC